MKRAFEIVVFISLFSLAFLPGRALGFVSPCSDSLIPPFLSNGVKPNILIILDNSGSMDQDFSGSTVGAWASGGKSMTARQAIQNVITKLETQANIGLMTFTLLPGQITYSKYSSYYGWGSLPQYSGYVWPAPLCSDGSNSFYPYYNKYNDPSSCSSNSDCNSYSGYPTCTNELKGYLHAPIGDINPADSGNQYSALQDMLTITSKDGYMACAADKLSDMNACPYIINAGGTPTAAVIQDALNYFNGTYTVPGQTSPESSPIQYACQRNFIILVTDGLPNELLNGYYHWDAAGTQDVMAQVTAGLQELDGVASQGTTVTTASGSVVPALGSFCAPVSATSGTLKSCTQNSDCSYGQTCLPAKTWSNVTRAFSGSTYTFPVQTYVLGIGSEVNSELDEMAVAGGTAVNGHAYLATDASQLTTELESVMANILSSVASGSSVSTIATSNQNGQNMLQADFYEEKSFDGTEISWPGYLYNWWYTIEEPSYCYNVDPSTGATTLTSTACTQDSDCSSNQECLPTQFTSIRQDNNAITTDGIPDFILDLQKDYILDFRFDSQHGLSAELYKDNNGTGNSLTDEGSATPDYLTPIWEAGKKLWQTSAADRVLYTPSSDGSKLVLFSPSNSDNSFLTTSGSSPLGDPSNFDHCLQGSSSSGTLQNLVSYVTGTDLSNKFCSNGTNFESLCSDGDGNYGPTPQACTQNSDCTNSSYPVCSYVPCSSSSTCTTSPYTQCVTDSCRNRTVGLCVDSIGNYTNTPCSSNSTCTSAGYDSCAYNTWKLGDIVYSTPKVAANYTYCYNNDTSTFTDTACTQDSDCSSLSSDSYSCQNKENVVFVGANDGMLHAFETGTLSTQGLSSTPTDTEVAKLTGISNSSMGKELWAFIPKNVLPYLRCLATGGCHLYYNDLSPFITTMYVDNASYCASSPGGTLTYTNQSCTSNSDCSGGDKCVSKGLEARKVLIGGLRLGGGSEDASTGTPSGYCFNSSGESDGVSCSNSTSGCPSGYDSSCSQALSTNVPTDTCSGGVVAAGDTGNGYTTSYNPANCTGLSSYYALDITDADNPKLLWEFTTPFLGYSYSGPAVIHKWSSPTGRTGDQYDVMFLSGPTDASDGSSTQALRAFVLKLDPNTLKIDSVYQTDFSDKDGDPIQDAFGGRLFTTGLDVDGDGYTDYVLFGYTSSNSDKSNWGGGIGLVYTDATTTDGSGNTVIDATNGVLPDKWKYDVTTYAGLPSVPITAQVAAESCFNKTYLFTGTGRYFKAMETYASSANSGLNYILGVPFTCNSLYKDCGTPSLNSVNSDSSSACTALTNDSQAGWMYSLSGASGSYLSERVITDPTIDPGTNTIFFTSTEPTDDPCGYGGQSAEWGFNCATGGPISDATCSGYVASSMAGALYLQTSTGAIYSVGNSNPASSSTSALSFSSTHNGGRSTAYVAGMPPETSLPLTSAPTGSGQLIQWMEK